MNTLERIKELMNKQSYLDLEEEFDDEMMYSTRLNGNVGTETPGQKDIKEAQKMKAKIKDEFDVKVDISVVDEFVQLIIEI